MASADAKEANEKYGVKVVFGDGKKGFWNEILKGNPRVSKVEDIKGGEKFCWVANYPSRRPYIDRLENGRIIFNKDFRASPGEIYLSPKEREFARTEISKTKVPMREYVVIEPNVKDNWIPGINKDWGWGKWLEVSKTKFPFIQVGKPTAKRLPGVRFIETRSFREAVSILEGAALLVTTDGGLHHAAAAMGVPAVVIWGGLASPVNLGYQSHKNIWSGADPCGNFREICGHCRSALDSVRPTEVIRSIEEILETG